jgi:hypothetical protein
MKKIIIYTLSIIVLQFTACHTYKTVSSKRIDCDDFRTFYIKDKPMQGAYKVRYGNRIYGFKNFENGLIEGKFLEYTKHVISTETNYKNGYKDSIEIWYKKGIKTISFSYKNGFLWGEKVYYEDNGIDTCFTIGYYADPYKMDIYVDDYYTMESDRNNHLNLIMQPCIIKADVYPQRYYLKSDSTLIYESIWHRIDSCSHINKQYGYKGFEFSD